MKKKKTTKQIIRQIVREEVAMAIQEVITELKQPTQSKPPKPIQEQYGDMKNNTPQQVPSSDPMSQFLNKDYREVLKKTDEKQKQKYGK